MIAVWVTGVRIKNMGIVDIAWSAGFTPVAGLYYFLAPGDPSRKLLITLMVTFWSARLGSHLYRRVMGHHPVEDARYAQYRDLGDAPEFLLAEIANFFEVYKLIEPGKESTVGSWANAAAAEQEIRAALERHSH